MFDLVRARTFITVVDTGSFTRAARILRLTKAGVSFQVKQLELEVGCELLVRTTRSSRPTPAGERFARAARSIVADAERAVVEARDDSEGLSGSFASTRPRNS